MAFFKVFANFHKSHKFFPASSRWGRAIIFFAFRPYLRSRITRPGDSLHLRFPRCRQKSPRGALITYRVSIAQAESTPQLTLNNHCLDPLGFISFVLFGTAPQDSLGSRTSCLPSLSSSRQRGTIFIDFWAVLLLAHCVFHYNTQTHTFLAPPSLRMSALVCSFLRLPPPYTL